jgi:hypothetical protein
MNLMVELRLHLASKPMQQYTIHIVYQRQRRSSMAVLTTASVYDTPMSVAFGARLPLREVMRRGIQRAFVMSGNARLSARHDFGLDRPVVFAHPDDYGVVAARAAAAHVIVCSARGAECILYLVPHDTWRVYECLVGSGDMLRDFVASFLSHRYVSMAYDEGSQTWRNDLHVDGFATLVADADGEFAGAVVDGLRLKTSDGYVDTTSPRMLDVAGKKYTGPKEPLQVSSEEVAAFMLAFDADQPNLAEAA